ncbi:MAG: N-acetylmuramoyl-L-alanine amidase, partial [Chloroflexota bacterium]
KSAGGEWTSWTGIDADDAMVDEASRRDIATDAPLEDASQQLPTASTYYGEQLLPVANGSESQARFSLIANSLGQSPQLVEFELINIDASGGPTTKEAVAKSASLAPKSMADDVPAPSVIPRSAWGANESWMTWTPEYAPVKKIIIHHTVTSNYDPDPAQTVRAIYYYHAVALGWGDIGYNYLVDQYGNIYEGRAGGADVIGAHTAGYNTSTLGIGNLGRYDGAANGGISPPNAVLDAIVRISAWSMSRQLINPLLSSDIAGVNTPNISGHNTYGNTVCPGEQMTARLPDIRTRTWNQMLAYHDAYQVRWENHIPPVKVQPGSTHNVAMSFANAGTLTWDAGGSNPVRVGYSWYTMDGVKLSLPPSDDLRTQIGETGSFGAHYALSNVQVKVPSTPGFYRLRWDLVHEGVTWFEWQSSPVLEQIVLVGQADNESYLPLVFRSQSRPAQPDSTPDPTPTPTPTPPPPPPPDCEQILLNPGFESTGSWATNNYVQYYSQDAHSGSRSMAIGILPGGANIQSWSSVAQLADLPDDLGSSMIWSMWIKPISIDTDSDYFYFGTYDQQNNYVPLTAPDLTVGVWQKVEFDISQYIDTFIEIRAGTYNNGVNGTSAMLVDDVQLTLCH